MKYAGSFESNDTRLNQIWEVAAYTAHLCMQDSIWDGIKRDRGRWIGDQEVIDRVVGDVFGDGRLVRDELAQDVGTGPLDDHVNGLPGYSAWWVVSEAEYLKRWGDLAFVREQKDHLLEVLARMEAELDDRGVYVAKSGRKPFVDWSKGLSADSPEARRATDFEYILGYRDAAWLLRQVGDEKEAGKWTARADAMTVAAQKYLVEDGTFGDRWQTNAIAVLAGAVTSDTQRDAVWSKVLSRTVAGRKAGDVVSPYYGDYVLNAMAALDKRHEALEWMRGYWGGMLDAGATSFGRRGTQPGRGLIRMRSWRRTTRLDTTRAWRMAGQAGQRRGRWKRCWGSKRWSRASNACRYGLELAGLRVGEGWGSDAARCGWCRGWKNRYIVTLPCGDGGRGTVTCRYGEDGWQRCEGHSCGRWNATASDVEPRGKIRI